MQLAVGRDIFCFVIVKIIAGDNLAYGGGFRLLVAEHSAFYLHAIDPLLQNELIIMQEGLFDCIGQLRFVASLSYADRGARVGGLDKDGEAEPTNCLLAQDGGIF